MGRKNDSSPQLGNIVKSLRKERGWSLADLGSRCGITPSTLSKVERGLLSLTYDRILQLANGLNVTVDQLFHEEKAAPVVHRITRRSVNNCGEGDTIKTDNYAYRYLHSDLLRKQQSPIVTTLSCRDIEDFGEMISHDGEEFTYVLKGKVRFCCEYYSENVLEEGDSIYFDSSMPHAYLNAGEGEAQVLTICTQIGSDNPDKP